MILQFNGGGIGKEKKLAIQKSSVRSMCFVSGFFSQQKQSTSNFYQCVSIVGKTSFFHWNRGVQHFQSGSQEGQLLCLSSGRSKAELSWEGIAFRQACPASKGKALGKCKRSNWLMGPWMLPASHIVHPPLPLPKQCFPWTISPGFGTDRLLNLDASDTAEQCPPNGDEGLSHVTSSLSVSASIFCCSKASCCYFYRKLSVA